MAALMVMTVAMMAFMPLFMVVVMTAPVVLLMVVVMTARMVLIVVMTMAALVAVIVAVMMVVPAADGTGIRLLLCEKVLGQGIAPLHGPQKLCAGELIPGGCDNGGALILLPQQSNGGLQCSGFQLLRAAEDDGPGVLHLVGVELAKVFQVDLRFGRIGHGNRAAQRHLRDLLRHILNSPD